MKSLIDFILIKYQKNKPTRRYIDAVADFAISKIASKFRTNKYAIFFLFPSLIMSV